MATHVVYAVFIISMSFFVTPLITAKDQADQTDDDLPSSENGIMENLWIFQLSQFNEFSRLAESNYQRKWVAKFPWTSDVGAS